MEWINSKEIQRQNTVFIVKMWQIPPTILHHISCAEEILSIKITIFANPPKYTEFNTKASKVCCVWKFFWSVNAKYFFNYFVKIISVHFVFRVQKVIIDKIRGKSVCLCCTSSFWWEVTPKIEQVFITGKYIKMYGEALFFCWA